MRNIFKTKEKPVVAESVEDVQVALNEVDVVIPAERPDANDADQSTDIDEDVAEAEEPQAMALASVKPTKRPIVPLTEEIEDNAGGVNSVDPITTASAPEEVVSVAAVSPSSNGATKGDWVIQIAAADSEGAAMDMLSDAKSKGGKALASAEPFTQAVKKGSSTLYRARFGGFDSKNAAWRACAALQKKKYGCYALNN
jgi:D-alanyl-D-alanine carboxypeptidase